MNTFLLKIEETKLYFKCLTKPNNTPNENEQEMLPYVYLFFITDLFAYLILINKVDSYWAANSV